MTDKWHGGKGSKPRPLDTSKWRENYERIWGKNKEKGDDGQRKKS